MKTNAIRVHKIGGPEEMKWEEIDVPEFFFQLFLRTLKPVQKVDWQDLSNYLPGFEQIPFSSFQCKWGGYIF